MTSSLHDALERVLQIPAYFRTTRSMETHGTRAANSSRMKRELILCSLGVVMALGFVGCTSNDADDSHRRTTGQYIDDKVLVQKVKAALSDSPVYKFPDVKVNTYNGVVQLTGFVESNEQKRKAEEIARNVRDVTSVQNQITLKADTERVRDQTDTRTTTTNRTTTTTTP
jgi:hyperosmotically inducible protein